MNQPRFAPKLGSHFVRAAFGEAQAAVTASRPSAVLRSRFGDDAAPALAILTKAAVDPAKTTQGGWAAELVSTSFGGYLGELAAFGGAPKLISLGVEYSLGNASTASFPAGTAQAAWVAEDGSIPVLAATLTDIDLGPRRRLAAIVAWTRELALRSVAFNVFRLMLDEAVQSALDYAYFSTAAGSGSVHAGLLAGLTPLTPASPGGVDAITEDLAALASAVSGPRSSGQVAFAMSKRQAMLLTIKAPELASKLVLLPTGALADGVIAAIDPASIVHHVDGEPDIVWSDQATLVMQDTSTPLSTAGSPPVAGAPAMSLFQTASAALRIVTAVAFAKRRPDCAAYLTGANW